jgi:hypothetical protein
MESESWEGFIFVVGCDIMRELGEAASQFSSGSPMDRFCFAKSITGVV